MNKVNNQENIVQLHLISEILVDLVDDTFAMFILFIACFSFKISIVLITRL